MDQPGIFWVNAFPLAVNNNGDGSANQIDGRFAPTGHRAAQSAIEGDHGIASRIFDRRNQTPIGKTANLAQGEKTKQSMRRRAGTTADNTTR